MAAYCDGFLYEGSGGCLANTFRRLSLQSAEARASRAHVRLSLSRQRLTRSCEGLTGGVRCGCGGLRGAASLLDKADLRRQQLQCRTLLARYL